MTNIEIRMIRGEPTLVCREWDGIDQPSYTPIVKLNAEEYTTDSHRWTWQRAGKLSNFGGELTSEVPYSVILGEWDPDSELCNFLFYETKGYWYLKCDTLFWSVGFDDKSDLTQLLLTFKGQTPYFIEPLKY